MILLPKELPELRNRLAAACAGPLVPPLMKVDIRTAETGISDDGADLAAATFAQVDAASFRDADLFHLGPEMVTLLTQAREGVGQAGFMDYDLPTQVGMAYFATPLEVRSSSNYTAEDIADYNRRAAEVGRDPINLDDDHEKQLLRFASLAYDEHLLCVWRVMPPEPPEYPHGYVRLSWWFEKNAWVRSHDRIGDALGKEGSIMPPAVIAALPPFVPHGYQVIALHPEAAEVRTEFTGGETPAVRRRPDMFRALCYLLRQRVAEESIAMPDRAARRRMKREGKEPSPVRVISIRAGSASGGGTGESGRDYVHRWIVRGHWRRQWYRSIQAHRPVWITPYVKGPEGAPLLGGEKVYTVSATPPETKP